MKIVHEPYDKPMFYAQCSFVVLVSAFVITLISWLIVLAVTA